MSDDYFLWPEGSVVRALSALPHLTAVSVIEEKLRNMFPTGEPVLCSSGRLALVYALLKSDLRRVDYVGCFPYASHCVLDAVSRVATPLCGPTAVSADLRLAYHQWGYVQEINLPSNTIEDCVDTLCVPGTSLFPAGGRFEIWSLPKILGTTSGGVLWCKDRKVAADIRDLRDSSRGAIFRWMLRLFGKYNRELHLCWQGIEGEIGNISRCQTGEIYKAIVKWDEVVADRLEKLEVAWPMAANWLDKPQTRLPPVVPTIVNHSDNEISSWGLSAGYRMFELIEGVESRHLVKVLPIPIHQDLHKNRLTEIVDRLCSG